MKYFLEVIGVSNGKIEVSKEEWIKAERRAGFRPKLPSTDPNYMKVCATGGFSSGELSGCIIYGDEI